MIAFRSSPEARVALRAGLGHKLASIRLAAVETLCELPVAVVYFLPELADVLHDPNEGVRQAAHACLEVLR